MAKKRGNLFLYLTIACFIGLMAIFVADGYMGIHDTLYITAGEQENKVDLDYWLRTEQPWRTWTQAGEKVFFRYQVNNNQFSQYSPNVEVSVTRMQEKVFGVPTQSVVIAPFKKGEIEWTVDTAELRPPNLPQQQGYQLSVIIKRGEIQRKVIIDVGAISSKGVEIPPTR